MLPTVEEGQGYDFQVPENAEKWRGIFVSSLRKVLEQVQPSMSAEWSALQFVESLCLRLLGMLCAAPPPLTVQDVEERVARTFPTPIDKWALNDARDALAKGKARRPLLPSDKVHQMLQKEVLQYKIDPAVSSFMTAILEYISADILKLAGNFVKQISQKSGYDRITYGDVKTSMCADKVLMDMFYQESVMEPPPGPPLPHSPLELVTALISDEKQYLRQLHLIIRLFKHELEKLLGDDVQTINLIFGNIVDIHDLTVALLGNLEDAVEMAEDAAPPVGSCFEDLAETEEFQTYVRYASIVLSKESRAALQRVVDDPVYSERLSTGGHHLHLCARYSLPRLLRAPVSRVSLYCKYIELLIAHAQPRDKLSLIQVQSNLLPIMKSLEKLMGKGAKVEIPDGGRARRAAALEKCAELARAIDNFTPLHSCTEFIREDTLCKLSGGRRSSERRAYMFDGCLLLCKPLNAGQTVSGAAAAALAAAGAGAAGAAGAGAGARGAAGAGAGAAAGLKLKEKLHVRRLVIVDKTDTAEMKHAVELTERGGPTLLLSCATAADKRGFLADLLLVSTRPMLDRTLDSILLDLEKRHPLRLPPPSLYRFAEPDGPHNLVLEERHAADAAPRIKGATLLKLVERLTYHVYADLQLVRTFLTTYRSFCAPRQLLALLVERFRTPPAACVCRQADAADGGGGDTDADKLSKNTVREDWKRYRKEFEQPVKLRVVNVIRHWVDQHFYDFEREPELLAELHAFLASVTARPMRKWVASVEKTLQRRLSAPADPPPPRAPSPPLELHPLAVSARDLALQLTALESDLYRQVKPSELVGAVWTKKDKEQSSPNLLRMIKHTTNFTRWMEKCIVEGESVQARAAVLARFIELGAALLAANNLNGVLSVAAACTSCSVYRLTHTYHAIPARLQRALEEFRELNGDHFRRYHARLRSANPPCVPFLGVYLTTLLHVEEGNRDCLPDSELINFSKRRKVAEITGEIQQYQNQPYTVAVEPRVRAFLETLDPFPGMDEHEITDYLYATSLQREPRDAKLPHKKMKKQRRAPDSISTSSAATDDNISVCTQLSPTGSAWDSTSVSPLPLAEDNVSRTSLTSPREASLLERAMDGASICSVTTTSTRLSMSSFREEPTSPRGRRSSPSPREPASPAAPAPAPRSPAPSPASPPAPAPPPRDAVDLLEAEIEESGPPPLLPRAAALPASPRPPEPAPDRPPLSPKHDLIRMSPKRSPAPPAPASPRVDRSPAFTFPSAPPPLTPHAPRGCSTPPPLPPRRRRDSAPPLAAQPGAPPLPPRPAPAALAPPALSALARRRAPNAAPALPPKPPPAAVPRS